MILTVLLLTGAMTVTKSLERNLIISVMSEVTEGEKKGVGGSEPFSFIKPSVSASSM